MDDLSIIESEEVPRALAEMTLDTSKPYTEFRVCAGCYGFEVWYGDESEMLCFIRSSKQARVEMIQRGDDSDDSYDSRRSEYCLMAL